MNIYSNIIDAAFQQAKSEHDDRHKRYNPKYFSSDWSKPFSKNKDAEIIELERVLTNPDTNNEQARNALYDFVKTSRNKHEWLLLAMFKQLHELKKTAGVAGEYLTHFYVLVSHMGPNDELNDRRLAHDKQAGCTMLGFLEPPTEFSHKPVSELLAYIAENPDYFTDDLEVFREALQKAIKQVTATRSDLTQLLECLENFEGTLSSKQRPGGPQWPLS